ncbi:LysR family transcriptional regulator [Neorhizobium sp. T786]|uniref:LysR family transcriptional regulator n=1 Tax=Pseudorhizobium xiangyangii TaxID=2883104 RepID=UPI001CFF599F|nr:LysR substrate-binding domain-containing protein [Neorhizobium xiangyangii]MCB5204612.1 LysR family transcriptional regulator [Neorhizobium xiangyangii]
MDLRQLRYFLQIAEAGSFSRAAELLHVAQPSLSQHIINLEEELGVPLLIRHPRGVTPTDFGHLLSEHARTILRDVERSRHSMLNAGENPSGEVTVGLPTSACRGLSVPLIAAAARQYPSISIHIVEAMTGSLEEWVQAGRIDVALLYDRRAFENLEMNDVMTEELRLIVQAAHPLAAARAVTFREASTLPLVLPATPNVIRSLVDRHAIRSDLELNIALNCDSLAAITELVHAGHATLYPSFPMSREIERGEFVAIPVVDPTPKWDLSVVLSKKTSNVRAASAAAQLVGEVARNLVRCGKWDAQLRRTARERPGLSTLT